VGKRSEDDMKTGHNIVLYYLFAYFIAYFILLLERVFRISPWSFLQFTWVIAAWFCSVLQSISLKRAIIGPAQIHF